MGPDHTFVILAYGDSPFLRGCLETLTAQTAPSRLLMTTSTPNEAISSAAQDYFVDLIVNRERLGIGDDWNFGLKSARTRFVTLVHQDDTYRPEFLERSMALLDCHGAAVAFTSYQEINDQGKGVSSKISRVKHLIELCTLGGTQLVPEWRMRLYLAFGVPLPCSSVTYDLEQLPDFSFSTEYAANLDWDAWLRLLDAGKRFVRDPSRLVGRRHNPLTATSRLLADGTRAREDLLLFRRIWPRPIADLLAVAYRMGY